MRIVEVKPPKRVLEKFDKTIFLAGVIDMGGAAYWQTEVVKYLKSKSSNSVKSVGVFNPRRNDWDSSWSQDINNEKFFEQVSWELSHINKSDIVIIYFTKDGKAPITLMELGKVSEIKSPENIIVFCPEGYYKKGNVDVLCYLKGISVHKELESFYAALDEALGIQSKKKVSEATMELLEPKIEETEENILDESLLQESFEILLFENTQTAVFGEENILVVSEYDEVLNEDSCMMGVITFKEKKAFAGLCKENDQLKATLYYKRKGSDQTLSETFKIVKVCDEYPEECVIFART